MSFPKSYILLNSGNVGSSVITTSLSNHNKIFSPWYEEFDEYNWTNNNEYSISNLSSVYFLKVFEYALSGSIEAEFPADLKENIPQNINTCLNMQVNSETMFGFKWRPWLPHQLNKKKFMVCFKNNQTLPIVPIRNNLLDYSLRDIFNKKFSSQVLYKFPNNHLQFFMSRDVCREDKYLKIMEELKLFNFQVSNDEIIELQNIMCNYLKDVENIFSWLDLFDLEPLFLYSNKITNDPLTSVNIILKHLNISHLELELFDTGIWRKAGMLSHEQCRNINNLIENKSIIELENNYKLMLNKYDLIHHSLSK